MSTQQRYMRDEKKRHLNSVYDSKRDMKILYLLD